MRIKEKHEHLKIKREFCALKKNWMKKTVKLKKTHAQTMIFLMMESFIITSILNKHRKGLTRNPFQT